MKYFYQISTCTNGIDFVSAFTILILDNGAVPTVRYLLFFWEILELFRQCGICCFSVRYWSCSDSVVFVVFLGDIGAVPIVRYLLFFLLDIGAVPTVWYLLFFWEILELFRQCGICCFSVRYWSCSDSAVFVVFLLDIGAVPTVWYLLFFC